MPKGVQFYMINFFKKEQNKHIKCLVVLVALFLTLLSGCNTGNTKTSNSNNTSQSNEGSSNNPASTDCTSFDSICDELFKYMVCSNSITLNYTLSNPEAFGITEQTPTLGEFSASEMYDEYAYYENKLAQLNSVDYETLSENDKLTYDIVKESIENYKDTGAYVMYSEPLGPTTGMQTQLPVLLSEFHFYNIQAIEDYLGILQCIPGYFNSILDYEDQKMDDGLFMGADAADEIIKECNEFIKEPENNYLIEIFEDNIANVPDITEEQITSFSARNSELITKTVIPAYKSLVEGIEKLKATATECVGLCKLPDGDEYYRSLILSQTGSSKSPKEIKSLLESALEDSKSAITKAITEDNKAYEEINKPKYAATEPDKILEYLNANISSEFPAVPGKTDNKYEIKYVHSSLEDSLSPAMFITPPIDCEVVDSIYINKSECNDSSIFTTLAHEGIPGHMYESEYFMSTHPEPIRNLLNFGGYSEGWATYAEVYSYSISGMSKNAAKILQNNKVALLCLYGLIDIGIHYDNWDRTDCAKLLVDNGITDNEAINDVYMAVITEPALYLKYILGYLEIEGLRKTAENELGDAFSAPAFHDFLLTTGPAWFDIISDRMDTWIKKQQ